MVFQVGGYEPAGDKSFVYLTFSVLNHISSWLFKPFCKQNKSNMKIFLISTTVTALQKNKQYTFSAKGCVNPQLLRFAVQTY